VADRVQVLRMGRRAAALPAEGTSVADLVGAMTGALDAPGAAPLRVLDGPLAPIPCASRTRFQPCEDCDVPTCQVRHLMLDVRNAIAEVLDKTSLSQMAALGGAEALQDSLSA